jgi:hypothetical protein
VARFTDEMVPEAKDSGHGRLGRYLVHGAPGDHSALPYGAVMATGTASQLAEPAGVGVLRLPLLWATVAVAVAIPCAKLLRCQPDPADRNSRDSAHGRFGEFTVPIGLAVISSGLAHVHGPAALATAACAAGLAWVATLIAGMVLVVPVATAWPGITVVDGTWFLAPAGLLADAIAVASLIGRSPEGMRSLLGWVALVAGSIGTLGYLLVLALAAARLAAIGLEGARRAPWWIAAGCGGLSAAALGRAGVVNPLGHGDEILRGFGWAALGLWAAGSAVLVPVVAGSIWYLARLRHIKGRPPWPPTFSTGVYALGAAQAGGLLALRPIVATAGVAAVATVSLWALTAAAYLPAARQAIAIARQGGAR